MYVLEGGEQYVSFEDIRCIAQYIAGDNIEIKLDNKIFHINHTNYKLRALESQGVNRDKSTLSRPVGGCF